MEKIIDNFWVPCFSGLYGTIWSTDNDSECELCNYWGVESITEEEYGDFDFKSYEKDN